MTTYAWGSGIADVYGQHIQPHCDDSNKLIVDGEEVRNVDFVDTERGQYRVMLTDDDGMFILDGDEVKKEWRQAQHSMEILLPKDSIHERKEYVRDEDD